jgi:ATP-dependent exoDNAse (exonuclease V) alpha subunit
LRVGHISIARRYIYRLSADVVKRSEGRTVTAAAAYRAGECITDARTGLVFPYDRRSGVAHTAILTPADAPAWMRTRAALWNAVEAGERRKDAQLARHIVLALPHELTPAQRVELVEGFAAAAFVDAGMVADIAIHAPDRHGDERNHHAHVLLTMRAIDGGSFGAKVRAWNETGLLERWRQQWAEHVNAALQEAGEAARVDHRSLAARGVDRLPQPKLGPAAQAMEARGIATELGDELREVAAVNAALAEAEQRQASPPATEPLRQVVPEIVQPGRDLVPWPPRPRAGLLAAFRTAARELWGRVQTAIRPAPPLRAAIAASQHLRR